MTNVRRVLAAVFCLLLTSAATFAQVVVVDSEMRAFTNKPKGLFATAPRLANAKDAELLIRETLGAERGDQVLRDLTSKGFYVVIHLLRWSDPSAEPGGKTTQTVEGQNWYVFSGDGGWRQTDFTAKRLYGSKGFYLLAVHLNRSPETPVYRLNYRVTIVKKQAANLANLAAAAKLLGADFDAIKLLSVESKPQDLWGSGYVPVDDVPSDVTIAPEIVVTGAGMGAVPDAAVRPGAPDPGKDGFTPAPRGAPGAQTNGAQPPARPVIPAPQEAGERPAEPIRPAERDAAVDAIAKMIEALHARVAALEDPSAVATLREQLGRLEAQIAARKGEGPQSLGEPQKFDNEGKYHWDVSVGVPVRRVSDFTRTETGLDVKTATKDTAFVMLNIYFKPVDVKTPAFNPVPSLLVGFGIEKEPLGRIFIGGGWGPTYANFFGGVAFKKYTEGSDKYKPEVTFGLNVPILGISKRLSEQTK